MPYAAILFDCDGVLVDSEPISLEILRKMLADLGWELSYAECKKQFIGKSTQEEIRLIQQKIAKKLDDDWLQAFIVRRNRALRQQLVAVPGIYQCLKSIRKRWPQHIACASAAEKTKILLQLDKVGLTDFFSGQIFSGMEQARNKPFPDVYLAAARALQVKASDCAIIEDSPTGIAAGVATGATVFGYCPDGEDATPLLQAGAQYIFHDMQQLPDLLQHPTSINP